MTYNRDLQEDKERLFDSVDTVRASVRLMGAMLEHTTVNAEACAKAAGDPAGFAISNEVRGGATQPTQALYSGNLS